MELRRGAAAVPAVLALIALLAAACSAGGGRQEGTAGSARRVAGVPAGIDPTGRSDVSAAMNRFFASVPDGTTVRLRPGARYRMETPLVLADRRDLTVDGAGATTFATTPGDRTRSHWVVRGGAGVKISNLTVRGANPEAGTGRGAYAVDKEAQHGFRLDGARDVELDHVTVTDVYGDFVYVGRDQAGTWSSRVWVHDSTFARNGRQGISVTSGRDVVVERNTITDTRQATIDLEPNSAEGGARNVFVLDNRVGPGRLLFLAAHGRGPVDVVVVVGNLLQGRPLSISVVPPGRARRRGFFIVDNRSDSPYTRSSMRFSRLDDVLVRANRQIVTRDDVAVVADKTCNMSVTGNDFGRGVRPVDDRGSACGPSSPLVVPSPPPLAGRQGAGAVVAPAGGDEDSRGRPAGRDRAPVVFSAAVLATVAGMVVAGLVRRARRAA